MPSCWAAACVLRLSEAKRNASALKVSSYLRRLSGVCLLFSALMTQESYILLLCALTRPPHFTLYTHVPDSLARCASFAPLAFESRRILLRVRVQGQERQLLFDSGSSAFVLLTSQDL